MHNTAENREPSGEQAPGFWGVEPRTGEDGSPDINFRLLKRDPPQEQRNLKEAVERALVVVKALYHQPADDQKRREAVAKLVALSQVGLVGSNASPKVAFDALRALKDEIVEREAGPIKNRYMRKLGKWSTIFGSLSFLFYIMYNHVPSFPFGEISRYRNFFLVWTGCMAGAWASFASRKVRLTFSDLVALEEDRIEPQLRLIFTGVLTIILAFVFTTGAADIHIGDFRTSNILNSGSVALLMGAFAGLAEKTLPSTVLSRANNVIGAVEQQA